MKNRHHMAAPSGAGDKPSSPVPSSSSTKSKTSSQRPDLLLLLSFVGVACVAFIGTSQARICMSPYLLLLNHTFTEGACVCMPMRERTDRCAVRSLGALQLRSCWLCWVPLVAAPLSFQFKKAKAARVLPPF
jgi:hypothetical protein